MHIIHLYILLSTPYSKIFFLYIRVLRVARAAACGCSPHKEKRPHKTVSYDENLFVLMFKDSNAGNLDRYSLVHACLHAEYELASEVCAHAAQVAAAYRYVILLIGLQLECDLDILRSGYGKANRILIGDEIEYRRTGHRLINKILVSLELRDLVKGLYLIQITVVSEIGKLSLLSESEIAEAQASVLFTSDQ